MRLDFTRFAPLALCLGMLISAGCSKSVASGPVSPSDGQSSRSSGPQEIDFGPKNTVPFTAIKAEARAPVVFNSEPEFQIRLKSGGTVEISESDLTTGDPNFQKRGLQFMALDTLALKKGARIVTGGNDLVIFANKIISEDGQIVAFTDKTRKAPDATDTGGAGSPGVSGGTVTLIAINGVDGRLHVDLSGQDGGNGAKGATGTPGIPGSKGEDAAWTLVNCDHDGGGGTAASPGQKGATGGPAGNGGHGGSFFLYNVGDQPVPTAAWDFTAKPGGTGNPGAGGDGGAGARGGEGGNGGGPCHGGPRGKDSAAGPPGDPGKPGSAGSPGNSLIKNMNLELVVKTAKEIDLNAH